jgi:hypothetical protein
MNAREIFLRDFYLTPFLIADRASAGSYFQAGPSSIVCLGGYSYHGLLKTFSRLKIARRLALPGAATHCLPPPKKHH